ncbi:hypothetical protein BDB00DRAFT_817838 [Zychaea mexicana]|uniref:uncharacterized protein n=1 Tax=Zychaea mexicana TaxID=64656 RepID=UPI0022FF19DD|nr:uncharacterized protein BDB00DRAFT_817838 [Zychaea mexicana]KAI9494682.1 hypothetical protein BDB00DRAFT_817838 [Zychaea mexicana]
MMTYSGDQCERSKKRVCVCLRGCMCGYTVHICIYQRRKRKVIDGINRPSKDHCFWQ